MWLWLAPMRQSVGNEGGIVLGWETKIRAEFLSIAKSGHRTHRQNVNELRMCVS